MYWELRVYFRGVCFSRISEGRLALRQDQENVMARYDGGPLASLTGGDPRLEDYVSRTLHSIPKGRQQKETVHFIIKGEFTSMFQSKYVLTVVLSIAMAGTSFALPKQADQSAKQDMKDAGHSTKEAAKDTAHATKKTAKKTGHEVKKTTKKATHKTA
jgi:hypothetical protein